MPLTQNLSDIQSYTASRDSEEMLVTVVIEDEKNVADGGNTHAHAQTDTESDDTGHNQETGGEQTADVKTEPTDDPAVAIESLRKQINEFETRAKQAQVDLENERRARDNERRAREDAERRAGQANASTLDVMRREHEARYDSVVNALAAATSQMAQAKAAYKVAMAEGDFDKSADLSESIGLIASRIRTFEDGKTELESRAKEISRQATEAPQSRPQTTVDPQDQFLATLPPRSADWVRQHRDRYFNDSSFQQMVAGAHNLAVGRGIPRESDAYFQFIEEQTGLKPAAVVEVKQETKPTATATTATATAPRRSPTPAAPASGSSPAAQRSSAGGGAVELTAQERDFCRMTGIEEAAYAKQKKQLRDEGLIGAAH